MTYAGYTLEQLEALEAAATPPPWQGDRLGDCFVFKVANQTASAMNCLVCGEEDTQLTMASRNALPHLLTEIKHLRGAVAAQDERNLKATVLMQMYGELMQGLCNALAPGVEDKGVASELACETLAELPEILERGKTLAAEKDARIAQLEAQLAAAGRERAGRELRAWADSESVLDGDPPHEIAKLFVDRAAAVACLRAAVVGTLRNARKRAAEIEAEGRANG